MDDLISDIVRFRDARGWSEFHTPDNLARALSVEAAELLECFQWGRPPDWHDVTEEVADVLIYALTMCHELGVSPESIVRNKMRKNESKYPTNEWKDRAW